MSALVRIVAPYAVFASLWVAASDSVLEALVSTPAEFADWSIFKGWLFVVVTAALLTALVRVELGRRGRADAALRESREQARRDEALLRAITEGIPDAIYAKDADGRYVMVNGATCALVGLQRESILGRRDAELFSPTEAARFVEIDRRVVATEVPETFEDTVEGDDGARVFVTTKGPVRRPGGQLEGVFGVARDVTARQRAERALRQREGQLRQLVQAIQALAAARQRDDVVAAVVSAARRLVDADAATVALRDGDRSTYVAEDALSPLFAGRTLARSECISGAVIEGREPVVVGDVTRDPRASATVYGGTFVKSLAMVPIGADAPIGALGTYWARHHAVEAEELALLETLGDAAAIALENARSYDELERRVAERTAELTRAKVRAESADRVKSAFLATMSHELRTPLNSIIGFTGILTQGMAGPLNDEQQKQLGMVQGSARHLLALINDVLDISKIEAGELTIHREPFDLRALIERVVASVLPLAAAKELTLSAAIAPELGDAVSDARRIEQILLNLLHNAIKFTERGSVALTATTDGEVVDVRVTDTGIGIRSEDITTLFHPFQQLDTGLARSHEGTGLGLAVSRRLAGLLGGTITVSSEWERGTTFTVTLPLEAPTVSERPAPPTPPRPSLPDEQPTP